ncbi:hypothetical protein AVL59_14645 [Streptomyces griseochromogenes]|nr:hypothetical protein AVL59_14645 [Streptomyces griseochromogenes]
MRGARLVGTLMLTSTDKFWSDHRFEPGPAWEELRPLFVASHEAREPGDEEAATAADETIHAPGGVRITRADHCVAIESTPGLQGRFIREFWGHGILQRVSDGRPAGRVGAGVYDNGVGAPGRREVCGGFDEAVHDGPLVAGGTGFADRAPRAALYEHREGAAPVGIRCFRHEGIVVANHQRTRALSRLAAAWELSLADGRILTGPAELPDLRPGETAAVPLPFALPPDGGEAWLTLRVTTAEDEPWAPRGTQVCAPRVRLRAPVAPASRPAVAGRPVQVPARLVPAGLHRRSRPLHAL